MKKALPFLAVMIGISGPLACADGIVRPLANYKGSLEEKSQEAIIVFRQGTAKKSAVEDLIIKIRVEGDAKNFAWIVPLPNPPETTKEDPKLFEELHQYVQRRTTRSYGKADAKVTPAAGSLRTNEVEVISRKVVGSFEVAVVRETQHGVLNAWLTREGYQPLVGGEKLIEEYRRKGYVFACTKVSEVALQKGSKVADLHPLRFTFETGGRDGIYFPMRITGLQKERFDVNLYVFYRAWLNDRLNKHGFTHEGFTLVHRDWDTKACKPNAGKTWSDPGSDPYLRGLKGTIPTVTKFFKKRHSGQRFYLTNIQASNMKPSKVLQAKSDLWLFPYYTDRQFVPFDKRAGGVAN